MDVFLKTRRNSELKGKDIDKAKNVGFMVYDRDIVTYEKASSDYLPITISVMPWLMVFIQSRWSFDHFQKVFESIHSKSKKCHVNTFFCTWGCQKKARGNSQNHSGRESIPDDASTTDLRASEHELVESKKTEKLPKIPQIGARDPGLNRASEGVKVGVRFLNKVFKPSI